MSTELAKCSTDKCSVEGLGTKSLFRPGSLVCYRGLVGLDAKLQVFGIVSSPRDSDGFVRVFWSDVGSSGLWVDPVTLEGSSISVEVY